MVPLTPTSAAVERPDRAYVWTWLPGRTEPVLAGVLEPDGDRLAFSYEHGYLEHDDTVPLYLPELPLRPGRQHPQGVLTVAGAIRDAAPGTWGRRVVRALRHRDRHGTGGADVLDGPEVLGYLLESGSDRIGALDFSTSGDRYVPRVAATSLAELQRATDEILSGGPPTSSLDALLVRGTPIGGARPKVVLRDLAPNGSRRGWVAKLSDRADPYPVVRSEAVAMDLAARVGLDVPETLLMESLGEDVLLVERFDRVPAARPGGASGPGSEAAARRMVVSAQTVLGLDEAHRGDATYPALADQIRARFSDPDEALRELFSRIVFNICVSNTDDHARNHSAYWDGRALSLTPAYDLTPQLRTSGTAAQAMAIDRRGRRESRFSVCLDAADVYHLERTAAADIVEHQVTVIREQWHDAADAARLTAADRQRMWEHQILGPAVG
jgi:serine/threonine-protein kinase HipA